MKNQNHGETREQARLRARQLLTLYPSLSAEELVELKLWFARRASSYDVALLSMDDKTAEAYLAFRRKHLDPFDITDGLKFVAFWSAMLGVIAAIGLLGA